MLSKFHKTTSEHWQRIPGTHKGTLQKEVGQNIKDKMRGKRVRDGDPSQEGIVKEKFPNTRKPHQWSVGSFGISEGSITGRKNK